MTTFSFHPRLIKYKQTKNIMRQKVVPSKWYKEYVNKLARIAMFNGAKYGITSEKYVKSKQKWLDFKDKYKPSADIKLGCLDGAKMEILTIKEKILSSMSIKDKYDAYNIIGVLVDKYYLSNKQIDLLMNFMEKHYLLY